MSFDLGVIVAFICYFIIVLAIGYYFYNKTHGMSDYLLGGRHMNPYVTAMSAQASDMSGWLLMGLPGSIYLFGIGEVWIGIGLAIGSYLAWLFVAKRLRKYSEISGDSLTISQFFSNRFKDDNGNLRLISSIIILVFFTFYVTSGFVAGGNVFLAIFPDMEYYPAVIITAAVLVLYTFLGGYRAVCWTDFVQAILMIVAVIVVPIVALNSINGGWDFVINSANTQVSHFTDIFWDGGKPITAVTLVSCLAWGLGYFGMPHIIVRYMAIEDPEEIKISRRVGTLWVVIALTCVALIALIGRGYFTGADVMTTSAEAQKIFLLMVGGCFTSVIAGILYAALMAAIMSTADSQLLVASSAVTNDMYVKLSEKSTKKLNDNQLMWISRFVVIGIAIIAMLMAYDPNSSIMNLVSFAWAGFGAAFGPIVLASLFWKRANGKGALAAMIIGFLTIILWNTFLVSGGIIPGMMGVNACLYDTGLYELLPGFIFATIALVVVSMMTKEPSKEVYEEFDKATEGKFY
jgi:sodium/proline symporter